MAGKINDGGPAFSAAWEAGGMSLRDWFAGQALAGMCASQPLNYAEREMFAFVAYDLADAMVAARAKGGAQ